MSTEQRLENLEHAHRRLKRFVVAVLLCFPASLLLGSQLVVVPHRHGPIHTDQIKIRNGFISLSDGRGKERLFLGLHGGEPEIIMRDGFGRQTLGISSIGDEIAVDLFRCGRNVTYIKEPTISVSVIRGLPSIKLAGHNGSIRLGTGPVKRGVGLHVLNHRGQEIGAVSIADNTVKMWNIGAEADPK